MERVNVYKLIDGERAYQNRKWDEEGRPLSDDVTPVPAWLIYMKHHIEQAFDGVYWLDEKIALEEVRKITALGVACMEHNETPPRK